MGAAAEGGGGGGSAGGVSGGGVSTEGAGEQLKSMVNHSAGCQEHPVPKARDKMRIIRTTICFLFTLFIVGSIIALESGENKRGGGMKAIHPLPGEKHREILVVLSLVTF